MLDFGDAKHLLASLLCAFRCPRLLSLGLTGSNTGFSDHVVGQHHWGFALGSPIASADIDLLQLGVQFQDFLGVEGFGDVVLDEVGQLLQLLEVGGVDLGGEGDQPGVLLLQALQVQLGQQL